MSKNKENLSKEYPILVFQIGQYKRSDFFFFLSTKTKNDTCGINCACND